MDSKFGKGLTYCLGLFLAHEAKYFHDKEQYKILSKPKSNKEKALLMNCDVVIDGMINVARDFKWTDKNLSKLFEMKKDVNDYLKEDDKSFIPHLVETLPSLWFSAASDHLYELQIPDGLEDDLKKRLHDFQDKCLHFRGYVQPEVTEEHVDWSIKECKELLMEIDKTLKVDVIKGDYE